MKKKWNCYVFLDFFLKKKDICTICYQYKLIFLLQNCRLCNWVQMAGIFFLMCCFLRWPRIPCKITNYHLLLNQKVKNEYIYIFDELKIKFKHQKHSWNAWKTTSNINKISKKKGCPFSSRGINSRKLITNENKQIRFYLEMKFIQYSKFSA